MDRDEKEDREILKFVLEQIYRAKRRKGQLDRRLENLKQDMRSAPGAQGRGRRTTGDHGDTAGQAIRESARMTTHIYNIFRALNTVAWLHGLEITEMRDRNTGKKFRKR